MQTRRVVRGSRLVPVVMLAAALSGMLAACTPEATPSVAPTAPTASSAAPTTAADAPLQLAPDGSAADNKAFFDSVNQALLASNPAAGGVEFTSALRTSGFDIATMQVTPDVTTVGVAADSVQFSVLWKNECLIGQYGHGVYTSTVAPVLGTGQCLIGQTRPIDW